MKISFNWLKEYIDISYNADEVSKLLTDTGLEVEGLEEIVNYAGELQGLYIGQVVSCEKHPNSDHLKLTEVDVGNEKFLTIVCGAPNIDRNQKVIVAPLGATIYTLDGQKLEISKRKIRGEVSEGMICSEFEVGIGNDQNGIKILQTNLPAGTPLSKLYPIQKDTIFEIGLTPNRSDATSHIGVARDVKAVINNEIKWPNTDDFEVENNDMSIEVEVWNNEACPRYSAVSISNVEVKESPAWLQKRLKSIGLTPINNIVDITNFVLFEVGQPLHAFDASVIKNQKIIVKTAERNQKFTTLDGKERTLNSNDLMICDGHQNGLCIAGVFGGIHSGITQNTTNVFLESAYFSPKYVRKTSQSSQIKTDASFRYERGADPEITLYALKRAVLLIKQLAGGVISSEIIDVYPNPIKPQNINISFKHIHKIIGKEIEHATVIKILNSLDIKTENVNEYDFIAVVPSYRTDVNREIDVIEEILRIYGFDNIDVSENMNLGFVSHFPILDELKWQEKITQSLVNNGFFEVITNSLTKNNFSYVDELESVQVLNKLSEDLSVLRQTMVFSLMETMIYNINRKQSDLKIFEFGKIYKKSKNNYNEKVILALGVTGKMISKHWNQETKNVDYYHLLSIVNMITSQFSNDPFQVITGHDSIFSYGAELFLNNIKIGEIGEVNKKICNSNGLYQEFFYSELYWEELVKQFNNKIIFREVSKYPEVKRDLSLVLDKNIAFSEVLLLAKKSQNNLLKNIYVFDVYEGENIGKNKKAYALSFILQDEHNTLTDKIIDKTMNELILNFENGLGAIIRK